MTSSVCVRGKGRLGTPSFMTAALCATTSGTSTSTQRSVRGSESRHGRASRPAARFTTRSSSPTCRRCSSSATVRASSSPCGSPGATARPARTRALPPVPPRTDRGRARRDRTESAWSGDRDSAIASQRGVARPPPQHIAAAATTTRSQRPPPSPPLLLPTAVAKPWLALGEETDSLGEEERALLES